MPFQEPSDELTGEVAAILMRPSSQRDRLTPDIYLGERHAHHPVKDLEHAFELVCDAAPIEKKMREKKVKDPLAARDAGVITSDEYERLMKVKDAVAKVVAVDAYDAQDVSPIADQHATQRKAGNDQIEPREAAE